ncbi:DUF397 domain-containing protein [Streptomyces rimosus]|uniref:DUF397 domain-containing protein n=1 Tax=Streptomyces rimosus TaxID=1927 RepID=UPI0004C17CA2|nr:DUF397 domain-containing protein [Streptomyces rimosus]
MSEPHWTKSSFSDAGGNNCVEVSSVCSGVALRESAAPTQILAIDRTVLRALLVRVSVGPFDSE